MLEGRDAVAGCAGTAARCDANPKPTNRSISPTCRASRTRCARTRGRRPPAATTSSWSVRPASARRCSPAACRRSCPTSIAPKRSRSRVSTRRPASALNRRLHTRPPFRGAAPQRVRVSRSVGGGSPRVRPGESHARASRRVVPRRDARVPDHVLEALRQPLEERVVRISRASGTIEFPADFLLVACANPCPCGRMEVECRCSDAQRMRYARRLSAPLLDRFDLRLRIESAGTEPGASSEEARHACDAAIERQGARLARNTLETQRTHSPRARSNGSVPFSGDARRGVDRRLPAAPPHRPGRGAGATCRAHVRRPRRPRDRDRRRRHARVRSYGRTCGECSTNDDRGRRRLRRSLSSPRPASAACSTPSAIPCRARGRARPAGDAFIGRCEESEPRDAGAALERTASSGVAPRTTRRAPYTRVDRRRRRLPDPRPAPRPAAGAARRRRAARRVRRAAGRHRRDTVGDTARPRRRTRARRLPRRRGRDGRERAGASGSTAPRTKGALDAGGLAVGVVATGLDVTYPRRHRALYERVREHGLVVGEHGYGVQPRRERFPVRNRIIAALADVVVVVEARRSGGARITAKLRGRLRPRRLRAARFAPKPGGARAATRSSPTAPSLLLDPARPARSRWAGAAPGRGAGRPPERTRRPTDDEAAVLRALGGDPATIDDSSATRKLARPGWERR